MLESGLKLAIIPLMDLTIGDLKPIVSIFQQTLKTHGIVTANWVMGELIGKPVEEIIDIAIQRSNEKVDGAKKNDITADLTNQFSVFYGNKEKSAFSKESILIIKDLQSKGIKIGITSWLDKKTTENALSVGNIINDITAFTHNELKIQQGTFPDAIFSLMRNANISSANAVANFGSTKIDILKGYHAQCNWNILITDDEKNPRWNSYPHTAIAAGLREAMNELLIKRGTTDFFKILNNKAKRRK